MNEQSILDALKSLPEGNAAPQAGTSRAQRFAGQGRLPGAALTVEIEGLGILGLPVGADQATALQRMGSPARFGKREQTLLDKAVRDTAEISADVLNLSWDDGAFAALQADVARALGVERLEALARNLLVYGPGQFFKPHQDTEKHLRMVGTLMLILPSPHIGGELRVQHGNDELRFASQQLQGQEIRWFAFYADCRHEVLAVEEGWRIALTLDLLLPECATSAKGQAHPALQHALRQHFGLDDAPSFDPWVLLLDHEYSEHGLRWPLLKGSDRSRVEALRAATDSLGLSAHLALAELYESWTAAPVDRFRHRRGTADAEPDELIDQTFTLDFWIDAQGNALRNKLSIDLAHTDSFTETDDAHLVDEAYEGYMGNYGETLEYWYRRAALVIQSPLAFERTRFVIDFDAALAELRELASSGADSARVAARVAAAGKLLGQAVSHRGRALLAAYAEIAAVLPDPEAATALMRGFSQPDFVPSDAATLARLEQARGTPWMRALLQSWTDPAERYRAWFPGMNADVTSGATLWPNPLVAFTEACIATGLSAALMDDWFAAHQDALARFDAEHATAAPAHRYASQRAHLDAVCQLASALRLAHASVNRLPALLEHVATYPGIYASEDLAPLVAAAGPAADTAPRGRSLRHRAADALHALLATPQREADDDSLWRIEWQCRCKDCESAVQWAESPDGAPLILPMAEARRAHVQTQLKAAAAPIAMATLKQGSPHKLQLTKPRDLQARDRALRERWQRDLDSLLN